MMDENAWNDYEDDRKGEADEVMNRPMAMMGDNDLLPRL